jgi:tripartite-type tricarboxylate transporter receptor subunit TctC
MRQIAFRMTAAALLAGLAALSAPTLSQAQSWPQRPVRLIVPFGPGAGADIGARLLSERLPARWGGKAVVIENRPGGDGLVAIQTFLSANDDHTFLFTPAGNFTVHPFQYDKLPYTNADLVPVARVSNTILGVGVPAAMNIGTVAEFVARAKAEPGKFNAAVVPGITEFTFDYFVKTAGLTLTKVPYRDIVQAATDVGEGRLQIYMASYAILQPQTEAGRIKTIVVNGRERAPILPNIPTAPAEFAAAIQAQRDQIAKIAQELGIKPKVQP